MTAMAYRVAGDSYLLAAANGMAVVCFIVTIAVVTTALYFAQAYLK